MNRAAYDALPGLRWSVLKLMRRSPLHMRHPPEPVDSDALALGTVTHVLTLEPHRADREIAVWVEGTRRGKRWDEFREAAAADGRTIITLEAHGRAQRIARAIHEHPIAGPLLVDGLAETPVRWIDRTTEIECKALLDWITGGSIVDLKTARSIEPHLFARSAHALGYFGQLAFYRRGLAMREGRDPRDVRTLLVAVESAPPHDVAVYEPDEDTMTAADCEVGELLDRVRRCQAADHWPGAHTEAIEPLRAPAWALDLTDEDDFGLIE